MGLIKCPDCKARISDAAPACIHCGRPMQSRSPPAREESPEAAQRTNDARSTDRYWDRVSEAGRQGARAAGDAAGEAAEKLADAASEAFDWSTSHARALRDRLREESEKLAGRILPECEVPTLLLPTGPRASDFVCTFEFDDVVAQLKGGRLTHPVLTVWAARSDVDRIKLAHLVREQFTRQLHEQKKRVAEESASRKPGKLKPLEDRQKEADEGVKAGAVTAIAALMFMLFVTNPLFDLLLLSLAVFGGSSAAVDFLRRLGASLKIEKARTELEQQRERLESELDEKSDRFKQAVTNMEIRVHRDLQAILLDFADLDSIAIKPEPAATEPGPWMKKYLQDPSYRDRLPDWYHPLLDQQLETL